MSAGRRSSPNSIEEQRGNVAAVAKAIDFKPKN